MVITERAILNRGFVLATKILFRVIKVYNKLIPWFDEKTNPSSPTVGVSHP